MLAVGADAIDEPPLPVRSAVHWTLRRSDWVMRMPGPSYSRRTVRRFDLSRQDLHCDNGLHDLGGSSVDARYPGVDEGSTDRILGGVPVPAEELEATVENAP